MTTLAIMRPAASLPGAVRLAKEKGFSVIAASMVALQPLRGEGFAPFLRSLFLGACDYVVFTSANGVAEAFRQAEGLGAGEGFLSGLSRTEVVAIGPKTAAALQAAGVRVRHVPLSHSSEGIFRHLSGLRPGGKVIALLRSREGSRDLASRLEGLGARVFDLPLYAVTMPEDRRAAEHLVRRAAEGQVDVFCFTDGESVRNFLALAVALGLQGEVTSQMRKAHVAALGRPTLLALEGAAIPVGIVPMETTFEALLDAVEKKVARRRAAHPGRL